MTGNPLFSGWYADPEAHIFKGRYYIYPTTSDVFEKQTFFEAFSSNDLTNWQHHGRILDFADIGWSTNRAAWAPSVAEKAGVFYLYFSAGDGAGIGVATSLSPIGPFKDALGEPLIKDYHHGAQPIDAHAFVDDDGRAYLYYGGWSHAAVVELGEDMVSVKGDFHEITPQSYVEGPFMLKRNGIYYFMWSEGGWTDSSYGVAYATSDNPFGPFVRKGCILSTDEKVAKGAGHHSVVCIPGTDDHYIVYHRRPLEETHANHRVSCIDRLCFDPEGEILPVKMTKEGVERRRI